MIHFHSVWYLWLGRDTEKEEGSRMGGGTEWLSQFTNTLPFLTVCTVLPCVFQYLITPCEWYPWSVFTEEETKDLKGLHDNSQSHS